MPKPNIYKRGSPARIAMFRRNEKTFRERANLARSRKGMIRATVKGMPSAAKKIASTIFRKGTIKNDANARRAIKIMNQPVPSGVSRKIIERRNRKLIESLNLR